MKDLSCCGNGSEEICNCGDRKNKLCMLTKPIRKFNVNKIKKLVNNPEFICTCYGRVANDKKHLCSPITLS